MPRVCHTDTQGASSAYDFCRACWDSPCLVIDKVADLEHETVEEAEQRMDPWPDQDGAAHPDYEGTDYTCDSCGNALTEKDD